MFSVDRNRLRAKRRIFLFWEMRAFNNYVITIHMLTPSHAKQLAMRSRQRQRSGEISGHLCNDLSTHAPRQTPSSWFAKYLRSGSCGSQRSGGNHFIHLNESCLAFCEDICVWLLGTYINPCFVLGQENSFTISLPLTYRTYVFQLSRVEIIKL